MQSKLDQETVLVNFQVLCGHTCNEIQADNPFYSSQPYGSGVAGFPLPWLVGWLGFMVFPLL